MDCFINYCYKYKPGEEYPCQCNLELELPVNQRDIGLNIDLQSYTTKLLGWVLTPEWGDFNDDNTTRSIIVVIADKNWEDLETKLDKKSIEIENTLKEVLKHNQQMKEKQPNNKMVGFPVG